jgi:hypothetical protein
LPQQGPSRPNPIQDYVTVAERIERFYDRYPDGRIITHIVEHDLERGFILMRAEGYRSADDSMPVATGHAFELRSEGYVNRTSYIENCESSCVGRMLAMMGFEVKRGIASREEIEKASRMNHRDPAPAAGKPDKGSDLPASDDQKQTILSLLESVRPGDRRAQRRVLVELTGKESRDDLTQTEAADLVQKLKAEAADGSI